MLSKKRCYSCYSCHLIAVGKASIGFMVDGMVGQHLKMIQRWVYNLALMFKRGSYLSFATIGDSLDAVRYF